MLFKAEEEPTVQLGYFHSTTRSFEARNARTIDQDANASGGSSVNDRLSEIILSRTAFGNEDLTRSVVSFNHGTRSKPRRYSIDLQGRMN